MSELRYEAPLATFDVDEWNEFLDLQTTGGTTTATTTTATLLPPPNDNSPLGSSPRHHGGHAGTLASAVDAFEEETGFTGSLEDLVNTFDARITKCFRNYNDQVEAFAPVQVRSEMEAGGADSSQMWWTLTGNFGNILPINWSSPQDSSTISPNDNEHSESKSDDDAFLETDDDDDSDEEREESSEEMGGAIDDEQPILTADDVINELEEMLEDGSPRRLRSVSRALSASVSAELRLYAQSLLLPGAVASRDDTDGLSKLSVRALRELVQELEACVCEHSEVLVAELALRDDLDYEKELKNQFIWLLLTVQKRRKEATAAMTTATSQADNGKLRSTDCLNGNGYLTTVIPYESTQGPPVVDKLQIFIRILSAINEDSSSVPTLLTDYILKVLCPTT